MKPSLKGCMFHLLLVLLFSGANGLRIIDPSIQTEKESKIFTPEQQAKISETMQLETFCHNLEKELRLNPTASTEKHYTKPDGSTITLRKENCPRFEYFQKIEQEGEARYDRQFDKSKPIDMRASRVYTKANLRAEAAAEIEEPNKFTIANQRDQSNSFIVNFTCGEGIDKTICAKAENAYHKVTKEISDNLKVKRKIILKAEYVSLCKVDKDSCGQGILGQAASAAFWNLDEKSNSKVKKGYWYPQALAKQLSDKELQWRDHDIYAQFNADSVDPKNPSSPSLFWFPEDGKPIQKNQYDFRYVVLHEVVHGLGFASTWSTYIPIAHTNKLGEYLSPAYMFYNNEQNEIFVDGIEPQSIFDRYIYIPSKKKYLSDSFFLFSENGLGDKSVPISEWRKRFNKSRAKTLSDYLYDLATQKESLQFKFPADSGCHANLAYFLHTRYNKFTPGSSLTHLDQTNYKTDSDALLMRPEADPGISIESRGDAATEDPLGDVTLSVLRLLGYDIVYGKHSKCKN